MLLFPGCLAKIEKDVATVITNTEAANATLETLSSQSGNAASSLKDIKGGMAEALIRLDAITGLLESPPIEVPQVIPAPQPTPAPSAAPPPERPSRHVASGPAITFQGEPIDLPKFLRRSATTVDIKGDVDAHLRAHGFGGELAMLDRQTKIRLHSIAHSMGVSAKVMPAAAAVAGGGSGCPNGQCSRYQASSSWSGWLGFRRR